ncbi:MAG TPA: hypothetical protein VJZ25_02460, partial [Gemmatimonadaceae bacterium]|nr:hypothetical protein [Gemmatimonadaceae bacterium]
MRTKAIRRVPLAILGLGGCLVVSAGCRTGSGPVRSDPREQILSLVDVDSMVFAAVVRGQLEGSDDAYPRRLTRFRYDSNPFRANSGYPDVLTGVEGTASSLSFPRVIQSESELNYMIDTRKRILRVSGVPEGKAVFYSQCAGAGVPMPPPPARPRGRSARRVPARHVHAGCPKVTEYYLTVGLPIHGQPPGLKDSRDTRGRTVRVDGEAWTVLVDETAVGP